ncbi:SUN domain-containing protein 2-like [Gopherus flavomarginatus]|uniref:SUN domain-containing protein 2-like n=1 Tax=Gopherus flavomarginatus TaxID=286002 RepID=UPI0021CBDAA3|nr:SUN domain-containing protein 2-like [Gopherus flavomarginatus]
MERRSGRLASLQNQKPNIYRETGVRRVFKRLYKSKHSSSVTRLKRHCIPEQDRCPHSDRDAEDSTEQHTCSTELHEGSSCSGKCLPETSTLIDTTNNSPVLHNQGHIPLEEQSRRVMKMVAFLAIIFLLGIFSAFVHGFRLPSGTCKQQMQLNLRHQNEILQQHLQREIDDFRRQIAELQIQVVTLAKTHGQQHWRTKKHPVGSVDSWVQGNSDCIQREDFALKSLGASVVKYSESYKTGAHICIFGLCWEYSRSPDVILQRDNTPGNCWALRGSRGYVVVKLSRVIHPLAVTLDHIAKEDSQTEEISSAPKNFAIYGLKEGFGEKGGAFLGEFVYDQEGFPVQTFKLEDPFSGNDIEIMVESGQRSDAPSPSQQRQPP